jgi:hypothetical protein
MSSISFVKVLDVDEPMIVTVLEFACRFSCCYFGMGSCAMATPRLAAKANKPTRQREKLRILPLNTDITPPNTIDRQRDR